MPPFKVLPGEKYGLLVTVEFKKHKWLCKCECGNFKDVNGYKLRNRYVISCGCLNRKKGKEHFNSTHALSKTKEYRSWSHIRGRCLCETDRGYRHYGARGIKVCDRWLESFENFLEDMGKCPEGLTLDRIDVNGPYSKENCRWTDWTTQQRNRRNNVKYEFRGQLRTIPEIAELLGIKKATLYTRWYRSGKLEI